MHYHHVCHIGKNGRLRLMFETHLSTFPAKAHWIFGELRRSPPNSAPLDCQLLEILVARTGVLCQSFVAGSGDGCQIEVHMTVKQNHHQCSTHASATSSSQEQNAPASDPVTHGATKCLEQATSCPRSADVRRFFSQCSRFCAHPLLVVVLLRYSDGISLAALTIHMSWQ